MRFLTSSGASRTSNPATVAVPELGGRKQVSILIVFVFPAPFGPRKPTICPFSISKALLSTADVRAYLLERSFTLIVESSFWKQEFLFWHCLVCHKNHRTHSP